MKIKSKKIKKVDNNLNNKETVLSPEKSEEIFNKKKYKGYIIEEYNTIYEIDYDEFARKHNRKQ